MALFVGHDRATPEGASPLLRLPVLVDEALILCVRIDGRQGGGHVPVDLHHFVMQERGDFKILLQDLLPGSEREKEGKRENKGIREVTPLFEKNIFATVALCSGGLASCYIKHCPCGLVANVGWSKRSLTVCTENPTFPSKYGLFSVWV